MSRRFWVCAVLAVLLTLAMLTIFYGVLGGTPEVSGAEPTATPPFTQTMTWLPVIERRFVTATPPIPGG